MFVDFDSRPVDRHVSKAGHKSKFILRDALKRIFDVCFATSTLLVISPLLIVVAIAIKLESKGPVFFRQTRNGLNGSTFEIFKYRSMRFAPEAEFVQATKGDARVTWLGAFLRKSSIDELPQLLNVLKGEMSIVGPRPHPLALDAQYAALIPHYMDRYKVKPGLTGLAQVSGHRGPTSTVDLMKNRLNSDLQYVTKQSAIFDLRILMQTIPAVLFTRNAF
jgi:putative colanic acid biosynthesis UDP-glucose lipid carrier transferase